MKTLRRTLVLTFAAGLFAMASVSVNAAAVTSNTNNVSPAVAQIVKMHDAGVPEDVLLSHVQSASVSAVNADEIIYLHEMGVSKTVITALIQKNHVPNDLATTQPADTKSSSRILAKPQWDQPPSGGTPPVAQESTTTPAVVTQSAPVYVQPAPVYVQPPVTYYAPSYYPYYYRPHYYPYYSGYYGPSFSIAFGFGHGHHGHGYYGHHGSYGHGGHWGGHSGGGLHYTGGGGHRGHH